MHQSAPEPVELKRLVDGLHYKDGWKVWIESDYDRGQGSRGYTLVVQLDTRDSYHPEERRVVDHLMAVPPAAFDLRSWRRWLLEQLLLVDVHEACENFQIDGERPYAPSHGPGNDPYMIREIGTEVDRRTSFRGTLNPT